MELPEAKPAGRHYEHDRVKVELPDGVLKYALIVSYDEAMKVYTVDLGGGVLSHGVEDSCITGIDHTGLWAGRHCIGRKVRIPHIGPREVDTQGTVRGYDDETSTYSVELKNGEIVDKLTFEQMKVPYE